MSLSREEKEEIWAVVDKPLGLDETVQNVLLGIFAVIKSVNARGLSPLDLKDPVAQMLAQLEDTSKFSPQRKVAANFFEEYLLLRYDLMSNDDLPALFAMYYSIYAHKYSMKMMGPNSFLDALERQLPRYAPEFTWPTEICPESYVAWKKLIMQLYKRSKLQELIASLFSLGAETQSPVDLTGKPRYRFPDLPSYIDLDRKMSVLDVGASRGGSLHSLLMRGKEYDGFGLKIVETWDLAVDLDAELITELRKMGARCIPHRGDFTERSFDEEYHRLYDLVMALNSIIPHMHPYFVEKGIKRMLQHLSPDSGICFISGAWEHWKKEKGAFTTAIIERVEDKYFIRFLGTEK